MNWHYPLISEVRDMYRDVDLSKVLLFACQHLLGSQYEMFTSLVKMGLKPKNCVIAGKPYSTNTQVFEDLQKAGFIVAPWSTEFAREEPFDVWFERKLDTFIGGELQRRWLCRYKRIVILDDGGFLHTVCNRHLKRSSKTAGVEQTSSGDTRVRALGLPYSVLSLARSYIKQRHEAPYIGKHACQRIVEHLEKRGKDKPRILVQGLGTVGRQILGRLKWLGNYDAYGCDKSLGAVSHFGTVQWLRHQEHVLHYSEATRRLSEFDVIVGASGSALLDETQIENLHPAVSLISVSSSDREFPATYFRKESLGGIHDDYYRGDRCLVNAGFPITFQGNYHEVPEREIELTVACLMAAVLTQAQPWRDFPFAIAAARLQGMWEPEAEQESLLTSPT
jgi:hypothetical protein